MDSLICVQDDNAHVGSEHHGECCPPCASHEGNAQNLLMLRDTPCSTPLSAHSMGLGRFGAVFRAASVEALDELPTCGRFVARRIALARIRGVEGHERCEGRDRHLAKVARGDVCAR
eukprot:CAMPEP_0119058820 /NCGR_PEP_ID=MMETSP1178-20130426/3090_1 /TAXON_ID=33656 /ORGANISM="unid sp, Strain CCMP2000" /LENGTH=116 /DNA_ID=CAMNT_0007039807 /DNA_START=201 /DNA_END=547 /DNA_ORIENTATION=+